MRILHVIDHLGCGGAQTVLLDLVRCWPDAGDELHVVGLGRQDSLLEKFPGRGGVVAECWRRPRYDAVPSGRLSRLLRDGQFDVVHSHLNRSLAALLFSSRPPHTRRVVHVHGDPGHDGRLRWLLRAAAGRVDAVLAVSQHTAQAVIGLAPRVAGQLACVPNGVDLGRVPVAAVRGRQGGSGGESRERRFVLGYVGRLDRAKGISCLLQALERLEPVVTVAMVGDGPLRNALQRECRRRRLHQRVRFAGFQSNVVPWLRACDALVLPSLTEGLPITVLEAFAAGTPVIATRVGGIEEAVEDGRTGLLVPPGDVSALSRAVDRLRSSTELRRRISEAARQRVVERFNASRMAVAVRRLYGAPGAVQAVTGASLPQ